MPRVAEEVSAGGLVIREFGGGPHGVLIARHDRRGRLIWTLPKGHVEAGETVEDAARREVREETGVTAEITRLLGTVAYSFDLPDRRVHKTVHHYLLRWIAGELSDLDGEVVEVAWVPLAELTGRLAYPDERRLLAEVTP